MMYMSESIFIQVWNILEVILLHNSFGEDSDNIRLMNLIVFHNILIHLLD